MKIKYLLVFLTFLLFGKALGQEFSIVGGATSFKTKFQLINNLIVIPLRINGDELNFILDSGVGANIIFNLSTDDSVTLYDLEEIELRGLGKDGPILAYHSKKNNFSLGKILGTNQEMYILTNEIYDLSTKLGINVHGVIGYEMFKEFIVKVNYRSQHLTFYNREQFNFKKLKSYTGFDLKFDRKKPFINGQVKLKSSPDYKKAHLLIDSGGGDDLWLFENPSRGINVPERSFYEYMGMGLSGKIYGQRSKIEKLKFDEFEFEAPNAAFPDSLSIGNARKYEERDGSIGGGILRRFHVFFDYEGKKIYLKKNGNYGLKFQYNLSGMELVYDGKMVVKAMVSTSFDLNKSNIVESKTINFDRLFDYEFRPIYKVYYVAEDSPAHQAGIQKGDVLVKINRKHAYDLTLEQINGFFYESTNKLRLTLKRDGVNYVTYLKLKDLF
ncbi:MAG: aspartyl protease family protein [Flavobacteriaceae bacterium]